MVTQSKWYFWPNDRFLSTTTTPCVFLCSFALELQRAEINPFTLKVTGLKVNSNPRPFEQTNHSFIPAQKFRRRYNRSSEILNLPLVAVANWQSIKLVWKDLSKRWLNYQWWSCSCKPSFPSISERFWVMIELSWLSSKWKIEHSDLINFITLITVFARYKSISSK